MCWSRGGARGEDEMLIDGRPWCGGKCGTQGPLPPTGRDYSAEAASPTH